MLKIINNLKPFFEDCYRRINVREYAKIMGISPPTASKVLMRYNSEGLLLKETYRNYILFHANSESGDFIDLSRMYWRNRLVKLLLAMEKELTNPCIVLFGSLSKAETKRDSDIDLAVFSGRKELDSAKIEAALKRRIHVLWFDSLGDVDNKELAGNIMNGYVLAGRLQT